VAVAETKRITKRVVDDAAPGARDLFVRDADVKGFGLKVSPGGGKTYFLEYRMGGREARKGRITIGRHGSPWTPDKARDRAKELLEQIRRGTDPVSEKAERNRLAVDLAFSRYADLFVEKYAKRSQVRSWAQAQRVLDHDIKPVLRDRPLHEITRGEVKRLLEELADRAPALARYAHAKLRKLFRWAVDRGDLSVSPIAEMKPPAPTVSRDRVLSDAELARVWHVAETLGYPFGPIVRMLAATGQRTNEVASMRWRDVDLDTRTWTIPAERAKNGQAHVVPLNDLAMAILANLPGIGSVDWAFTTTGNTAPSGWSGAKRRLDERVATDGHSGSGVATVAGEALEPWRLHDLRRTVATGLQRLGVRVEVTEAVLNHRSGTTAGIVGVYQRHHFSDEKRAALDSWSSHVESLIAVAGTE
jgi:integrase